MDLLSNAANLYATALAQGRLTPQSEAGNVLGIANTCRSRLLHLDVRWRMLAGITADSNATHSLSTYGHHSAMLGRWSARH